MTDIKITTSRIISITIFSILNFLIVETFARQNRPIEPSFQATFISDTSHLPDSVCILTYPNGWFFDVSTIVSKVDKNGSFRFHLPRTERALKIQIAPYRTDKSGKLDIIGEYFVLPNDQIQLKILKNEGKTTLLFYGKGAEKYNLVEELKSNYEQYKQRWPSINMFSITDTSDLNRKLGQLATLATDFNNKKNKLIADAKLENGISRIIQYEYTNYFSEWSFRTNLLFKKYPQYQEPIRQYYKNHQDKFSYKPDELSVICPRFIIAISQRIKAELNIFSDSRKVVLKSFFDTIKNKYNGKVRERLLIEFFIGEYALNNISEYDPQMYDSLVNEAGALKGNPLLHNVISKKIRLKKGSEIFPGEFTDINNQKVNLASLKGKVILLDVWGAGCSGCIGFHSRFKKYVYPFFKKQ